MRFFLMCMCLFLPVLSFAQVNIESQRFQNKEGFSSFLSLGSEIKKGNNDVFDLKASGRLDHRNKSHHFFFVVSYEQGEANGEEYKNSSFIHVRETHMTFGAFGFELFAQAQNNQFNDLKLRQLLGGGLRLEHKKEKSYVISMGLGAMSEYEELISSVGEGYTFRSTNYISARKEMVERKVILFLIGYYQPKFFDFSDYRILSDAGFEFKIQDQLSVTNSMRFSYDSRPPSEITTYDLSNLVIFKYIW